MFNSYHWDLYLNAGGRNIVKMFESNLTVYFSEEYIEKIAELHKFYYSIGSDINSEQLYRLYKDLYENVKTINETNILGAFAISEGKYTTKTALDDIFNYFNNALEWSFKDIFNFCITDNFEYMSTFLSMQMPELFVPYYFQWNFNVLQKIADEFDILLPSVPIKKDYKGRFYYYGELCNVFLDFRNKHNMTPYEFYAFLYDYAPKVIGGINSYIIRDIPKATSAFFIGGSEKDERWPSESDTITCWQCSKEAKPGDYAVMYLKTPVSSVDSVWRCVSEGFIDPFVYYYRFAYIATPQKITRIHKSMLEKDSILSQMPIIKKNLQGLNGKEFKPSEYNRLMELGKRPDLKLNYSQPVSDIEIARESDVERLLIKPLLENLKYKSTDYKQQLCIEVGNHNTMLIPDFLLLPDETKGAQNAFAVIEAKFDIPSKTAFEEVKIQARSYARQVLAQYCVIASKDKIYISAHDDDFKYDFFIKTWKEINEPDTFSKLFKILGKNR